METLNWRSQMMEVLNNPYLVVGGAIAAAAAFATFGSKLLDDYTVLAVGGAIALAVLFS
jgi:hypothetical protein